MRGAFPGSLDYIMTGNWSLKYRPQSLEDCVLDHLDADAKRMLLALAKTDELPSLLFYGPPGTGKTSIARILCDEERFVVDIFNGSEIEKRGIAEIEERMGGNVFGKPRCILIDEVDGMTAKAQMALRNLLDVSSAPVSWLFTANEVGQIHKALWSRVIAIDCSYSQPDRREAHVKAIMKRFKHILRTEKIRKVDDSVIREIIELHYPDLRKTILSLQMKLGYANKAA